MIQFFVCEVYLFGHYSQQIRCSLYSFCSSFSLMTTVIVILQLSKFQINVSPFLIPKRLIKPIGIGVVYFPFDSTVVFKPLSIIRFAFHFVPNHIIVATSSYLIPYLTSCNIASPYITRLCITLPYQASHYHKNH